MESSRDVNDIISERLRRREPAALPELYDLYGDRLYAFVFNMVDRDHGIAEDIVQDVWLSAVKMIDRYEGRSRPYTWLCGIAVHKVKDHWRRKGRDADRRYDPPSGERAESLELMDSAPLPEDVVEHEDTRRIVREALASLPQHYRMMLLLKYVEQMSAKEIGELMEMSVKAVESSIGRAKLALRDRVTGAN